MTKVFARDIIREELKRYKIDWDCLCSDTKTGRLVKIRHYIMWRARKETGMSFTELGRIFNRDHTSVLYAYRKAERLYRSGGILQIRPTPPAKEVGGARLDIPLRSGATPRGLLELIQVGGKWEARRAGHSSANI